MSRTQKEEASVIQDWLNHPGWDIVSKQLTEEADSLNSRLISSDDDEETKNLKYELRAIKKFINKIAFYQSI